MLQWFKQLDDVLRGKVADPERLAEGTEHIQVGPLIAVSILLGAVYGVFMGMFAVFTREEPSYLQMLASAVKVPALFFLTLVVTFPSLYVFSALLGVRTGPKDTLRLVAAPLAVNLAVLASFAPITAFFTLNATSYHFMKLLNVAFFAAAGFIGLGVLLKLLRRLETAQSGPLPEAPGPRPLTQTDADGKPDHEATVAALREHDRRRAAYSAARFDQERAQWTFRVWLLLYALLGAQMGWVLRPFIGSPELPFQVFRAREANIFIDIARSLGELLGA